MPTDHESPIRVGIGLIGREGCYLIRRRPPGSAMAGLWEFPGGKCEPGESPAEATARECLEEVGIEVEVGALVHRVVRRYPHGLVDLHYHRCSIPTDLDGVPDPSSGFAWVSSRDLSAYHFPDANDAVVAILAREARSRGPERGEP